MKNVELTVAIHRDAGIVTIASDQHHGKAYDKIRTAGDVGTAVKDYLMEIEEDGVAE